MKQVYLAGSVVWRLIAHTVVTDLAPNLNAALAYLQ